jgi:ArsR family transcriptional regulator
MAAPAKNTVLDRLSVLADPTRSRILLLLDRHELTVGELCSALQLPQSTVSRHLKLLADDGWLVARGEATSRFYRMVASQLDAPTKDLWSLVRAQGLGLGWSIAGRASRRECARQASRQSSGSFF